MHAHSLVDVAKPCALRDQRCSRTIARVYSQVVRATWHIPAQTVPPVEPLIFEPTLGYALPSKSRFADHRAGPQRHNKNHNVRDHRLRCTTRLGVAPPGKLLHQLRRKTSPQLLEMRRPDQPAKTHADATLPTPYEPKLELLHLHAAPLREHQHSNPRGCEF